MRTPAYQLADHALACAGLSRPVAMVTGFWRSGTTWLQEFLAATVQAKTVFEPLSPDNRPWSEALADAGVTDAHLREVHIPPPADAAAPLWRHMDDAVSGARPTPAILRARRSVRESLRRDVVIKEVRLQMNLEAAHRRYAVPIVHIRRHPCAVVASLLAARSNRWSLDFGAVAIGAAVALMQTGAPALVPDGIVPTDFDGDALSRVAFYWALTERWVATVMADQPWAVPVQYEDLVADPQSAILAVCAAAGLTPRAVGRPDRDSVTTFKSVRGVPVEERADAWRSQLTERDADRVMEVVRAVHPRGADGDA